MTETLTAMDFEEEEAPVESFGGSLSPSNSADLGRSEELPPASSYDEAKPDSSTYEAPAPGKFASSYDSFEENSSPTTVLWLYKTKRNKQPVAICYC